MSIRAAIYIRTSSETQGGKSNPSEQEGDCQTLAKEKGLQVVRVYRDVEKYRVANKLVEPSGSRSDRLGLLAMLKDASRDEIDVILAWREDQTVSWNTSDVDSLGGRPGLQNRETVGKRRFRSQDRSYPCLGSPNRIGQDERTDGDGSDRTLKAGKATTGQDRYGYVRIGEHIHIQEEEAKWVYQIFAWYIQKTALMQI